MKQLFFIFLSLFCGSLFSQKCGTCKIDTFFLEKAIHTSPSFLGFECDDLVIKVSTEGKETNKQIMRWVSLNIEPRNLSNMGRVEVSRRVRAKGYRLEVKRIGG